MRYYYGTNDSYSQNKGRTVSVAQLASIIKRDVEVGKWNIYNGNAESTSLACCKYVFIKGEHYEKLFIDGKREEFRKLETLIKEYIEVIPRQFQ